MQPITLPVIDPALQEALKTVIAQQEDEEQRRRCLALKLDELERAVRSGKSTGDRLYDMLLAHKAIDTPTRRACEQMFSELKARAGGVVIEARIWIERDQYAIKPETRATREHVIFRRIDTPHCMHPRYPRDLWIGDVESIAVQVHNGAWCDAKLTGHTNARPELTLRPKDVLQHHENERRFGIIEGPTILMWAELHITPEHIEQFLSRCTHPDIMRRLYNQATETLLGD